MTAAVCGPIDQQIGLAPVFPFRIRNRKRGGWGDFGTAPDIKNGGWFAVAAIVIAAFPATKIAAATRCTTYARR
jgi:hypothetical protein